MKKALINIIRIYQKVISPFNYRCCRFYPTCSQYAIEAIERYGPRKGSALAAKRLIRCHPFSDGGHDPLQ